MTTNYQGAMRGDFIKVLTERPRHNSGMKYRHGRKIARRQKIGEDDFAGRESMSMRDKEFSDLIAPLHRYVQSRVGKKWDKTYSEICAHLKGRNTVQQHLIGHLNQYVERHVEFDEKNRPVSKSWKPYRFGGERGLYSDFYVDPRDGILKAAPKRERGWWRHRNKPEPITKIKLDDGTFHEQIDGIWYLTSYKTVTHSYRAYLGDGELHYYTKEEMTKSQLSGRELKAAGLQNVVPEE